ncbi:MAG: DegV family protein, partial [Clostridia bacterium]
MSNYVLTADSTVDVFDNYLKDNNIDIIPMPFLVNDVEYGIDKNLSDKEFYQLIREGAKTKTAQVSLYLAREVFERILSEGKDVLHICFSSGMSGSFDNLCAMRNELKEIYPDRKIMICDSLSGGGGEGLLVYYANEMKKKGKSIEQVFQWLEDTKMQVHHYFIVEDLDRLFKSGRISRAQVFIGNILNIKPILELNRKGKVTPIFKIRGIRKAVSTMVDMTSNQLDKAQNEFIMIGHGDDLEKAKVLGEALQQKMNMPIVYNYINQLVGSHVGISALVVYFIG